MNKHLFSVYSLDVLGNELEGFEVNDRNNLGDVELDPSDDQDIIQALLDADILASFSGTVADTFVIDGDDSLIFIDSKSDGFPLLQLERVRGEE